MSRPGPIVAVGGGGGFLEPHKRIRLDRELRRLIGKSRPRVLYLPTASGDLADHGRRATEHFGKRWGSRVDVMTLFRHRPSRDELRRRILGADLIYVGGGNTYRMIRLWKKRGVLRWLRAAHERGTVMGGVSAGAICWFRYGNSDSRKKHPRDKNLIRVSGMGWFEGLLCPHYDSEAYRQLSLKRMMRWTPGVAIALEDYTAIEIVKGRYRVFAFQPGRKAYRVYWKKGKYCREIILERKGWANFRDLVTK